MSSFHGYHGGKLIIQTEPFFIESQPFEEEYFSPRELLKVINEVRGFEDVEVGKIFNIISKHSFERLLRKNEKVVIHFSFANDHDDILHEIEKKYENFVKTTTHQIVFAVVHQDIWKNNGYSEDRRYLEKLSVRGRSSFYGYHDGELVSKTKETFEIEDLEKLASKISEFEGRDSSDESSCDGDFSTVRSD